MTEPFFSRWSKRKQALARGLPVEDPATPDRQAASSPGAVHGRVVPDVGASAAQPSGHLGKADQPDTRPCDTPAQALPTLEDARGLTTESDFQPFMRPGVTSEVRNAAVKKLFADPHFNVMDGLDIYIGDYNTPDPLPVGMLQKMVGAQLLNLFPATDDAPPASGSQTVALSAARENPEQSPDAAEVASVVAQSPPSPMTPALQAPVPACPPPQHDHPDLQLQPDHAPASPDPGQSTG